MTINIYFCKKVFIDYLLCFSDTNYIKGSFCETVENEADQNVHTSFLCLHETRKNYWTVYLRLGLLSVELHNTSRL